MNTRRPSFIVTILVLYIITACSAAQSTEINPPNKTQANNVETLVFDDTVEDQGIPSPVSEDTLIIGSQTVITRENAHTLTEIEHLGKGNINDIVWSPSGSPIALATATGIYLIDPQTYDEVHFSNTSSNNLAFSKDGSYLASSEENLVILRDLETGYTQGVLEGHTERVYRVAFSPAESLLASASQDETIKLWDLVSGDKVQTLNGPGSFVHHIAFTPDGKTLVSAAYDNDITLWDVASGVAIETESKISGVHFAVSPAGETIAVGGDNNPLRLVDFNGQINMTLDEDQNSVIDLTFSPDGKILASATINRQQENGLNIALKLWDTTRGDILHTLDEEDGYNKISFSPDGTQLAAATLDTATLWDVENGQKITILTDHRDTHEIKDYGNSGVNDFTWSPDGTDLAMATFRGVDLVNLQTYKKNHIDIGEDGFFPNGHVITFSPDGNLLAVSYISITSRGFVKIYDVSAQEVLFTLDDFEEDTFGIAFSPDNSFLATGWGNTWGFAPGGVKLWEVPTGVLTIEYKYEGLATIYDLTFNREGNLLATINGEGYVDIWDVENGQEIQHFQGTGGYGYAVAFSPDGKVLAVGGDANSTTACLRLIDLETEEVLFDLQGHEEWYVSSVAFNTDGGVLASTSQDGTVRLWDTQTGQQLAVLDVPAATRAAFSPDGTLLATAGYRDVLRLWGVADEDQE